jgi:alpha-amylase
MRFFRLWGAGSWRLKSARDKTVEVTVPALSAVVYRAAHRLQRPRSAPAIALTVAPQVSGRPEVTATVTGDSLYAVSFYARPAGERRWTALGTDDSAAYRVFPDVSGYAVGTALELLAVVKDGAGHVASARGSTTVAAAPGGGGGVATLHYHRADGNYTGWGLHLWGDAIADGVGTTWESPRAPTRFDDFGAVFEIPLSDPAASLNYIIHQPSGDSVPATREPGGDRSYVPAVSPEVWVVSGDPTIHTSRP